MSAAHRMTPMCRWAGFVPVSRGLRRQHRQAQLDPARDPNL